MTAAPFATIIVPTYNQAAFLPAALDSIIAQTDGDWEAVVVNDGSTDNTHEIAEEYARRDLRIRVIHQPNGGVASALNTALRHARGEWIHWLSSDDLFETEKLAINRSWIAQNQDSNFFFSYFTLLRHSTGVMERRELWGPLPALEHQILTLFYRNYISGITICVKRSAWEAVGLFDEKLRYAQDYDQWLRTLQENKGVFIPEWTVISRNHADQGSETFPAACYYDTAKAAINFINRHTFQELVPWADLADAKAAELAVTVALDVAFERTAFVYSIGPHPALISRILEWVFSANCSFLELQDLVRSRVKAMAFVHGDDDWAWMWRHIALAIMPEHPRFEFEAINPAQLAVQQWHARTVRRDADVETLAQYLQRFESIRVQELGTIPLENSRVVFLPDLQANPDTVIEAANQLASRGYRPVILAPPADTSAPTWTLHGVVPVVRASDANIDTLPWLGDVEIVVTTKQDSDHYWLGFRAAIVLSDSWSAAEIESRVSGLRASPALTVPRPVVFIERVLRGGGAERVVLDIVRHLDRSRYAPQVWTMFAENGTTLTEAEFPHRALYKTTPTTSFTVASAFAVRSSLKGRILALAHRSFHRIVPPELRQRLGIGRYSARIQRKSAHATNFTVASAVRRSFKGRMLALAHRSYHGVVPPELRRTLGVGRFIVGIHDWMARTAAIPAAPVIQPQAVESEVIKAPPVSPTTNFDFISAAAHHQPQSQAVAQAISDLPADAVIVAVMEEAAVAAWLAQSAAAFPYISSLHTVESACLQDIYQAADRLTAERWLFRHACEGAETVVFPSQGCGVDLVQNLSVGADRLNIIANPADCSHVRRQSLEESEAVSAWKRRESGFRLVHVGRLDPQKNHNLLLDACAELKRRGRDFSLALVGDGWARYKIEKKIEQLGLQDIVLLAGEQSNPFPWIAAADTLVLTSEFEAFGLVLVEAMICGTPIAAVDCPVGPREVLNDGEFGVLITDQRSTGVATAIETLMDEPSLRQRLVEQGYQRALTYDVKSIVPRWQELFDKMPSKKN